MEPDLDLAEVHLAILHGTGDWPDLKVTPLLADVLVPLCSPSHPIMQQFLCEPADLLEHGLLHGEQAENWHAWFAGVGMAHVNPTSGPNFSNPSLMLQAAEQGQGIALASLVLAAEAVGDGRLTSPVNKGLRSSHGYYLVTREDGLKSQNLPPFLGWLMSEAKTFDTGLYAQLQANYVLR